MFFASLSKVIFYEKTGCGGNARQKELLRKYGITLEVRSILDTLWDKTTLEAFFEGLSSKEILNPFAPQIKEGFDVDTYSKDELIDKMLKEPILIKRPLLQIGDIKLCGFDIKKLNALLHVNMPIPKDINKCLSSDECNKS
ncbi:MAG: ArsC/Spx/MgsR family protein [Campylobacteraceae bacterium]